jgi:hypothetical protein
LWCCISSTQAIATLPADLQLRLRLHIRHTFFKQAANAVPAKLIFWQKKPVKNDNDNQPRVYSYDDVLVGNPRNILLSQDMILNMDSADTRPFLNSMWSGLNTTESYVAFSADAARVDSATAKKQLTFRLDEPKQPGDDINISADDQNGMQILKPELHQVTLRPIIAEGYANLCRAYSGGGPSYPMIPPLKKCMMYARLIFTNNTRNPPVGCAFAAEREYECLTNSNWGDKPDHVYEFDMPRVGQQILAAQAGVMY